MVDELAAQYDAAGRPVVFLEHAVTHPQGNRLDRWYGAYEGNRFCGVPLVMVDSGWRWTCGGEDFRTVYSGLVDEALENPAGADLAGEFERTANDLTVTLELTNLSGGALGETNEATANVIVFERTEVIHTERFVRAAAEAAITTDLPHGETGVYEVSLANVPVDSWDEAEVLVLVDYKPNPTQPLFVSLQAAIATDSQALTPTATIPGTPAATSDTTGTATCTATSSSTTTATPDPTETATSLPAESATASPTGQATATTSDTATSTPAPSSTMTPTPTSTVETVASPTAFPTVTASATHRPTATTGPHERRSYLPFLWRSRRPMVAP